MSTTRQLSEAEMSQIVDRTAAHVRELFTGESSGHDWWHVYRVWQNAKQIARHEAADLFTVELAALLHDIADQKFHGGDDTAGPRAARAWLETQQLDEVTIDEVCDIIGGLSYKGAGTAIEVLSMEGKIVQDADRLDAIGAIGIGRAFAYGGHAGRSMHDPDVPPVMHENYGAYKSSKGPTINHFYEKLLLLKDRMNTATGRTIAASRHLVLENFLRQFLDEFEGRDLSAPADDGGRPV